MDKTGVYKPSRLGEIKDKFTKDVVQTSKSIDNSINWDFMRTGSQDNLSVDLYAPLAFHTNHNFGISHNENL